MIRTESIARFILIIVFSWLLIGATATGILTPDFQLATLSLMVVFTVLWLVTRWRKRWTWHPTILDVAFFIWIVAFLLTLYANQEVWRRSLIGLWYMAVNIGVWYVLYDTISNRGIDRDVWIDGLLIVGLIAMIFGYWQAFNVYQDFTRIRGVVSLLGNPNTFGAFLVTITPFAIARSILARQRLARIVLRIYSICSILMLILTFSRGAWLGGLVSWIVLSVLLLAHHQMLSISRLHQWFQNLSRIRRLFLIVNTIFAGLILLAGIVWIIQSFSISGRSLELRTRLWKAGLIQFAEKPITGQGFYAFGYDYPLQVSIPPENTHSHAHNILIQIMAEMGAVGLFAFVISAWMVFKQCYRNWQEFPPRSKTALIGAIAALIGLGTHQLVDIPMMFPIIALSGLLVLAIATVPATPKTTSFTLQRIGYPVGLVILWVVIFGTGFWSANLQSQFRSAIRYAVDTEDFAGAAERLQPVIDADPNLAIYHQQQAFLWGTSAAEGNDDSARKAIMAYDRFLELEPNHATSWANRGVLHWQTGDEQQAVADLAQALRLAPDFDLARDRLNDYVSATEDYTFEPVTEDITEIDYLFGVNYGQLQFWRNVLPRQYLPQLSEE